MVEMVSTIVSAIISAAALVIVARMEMQSKKEREEAEKRRKEAEERQEIRAARRKQESFLSLRMMSATLQLSVVTSNALTGGHNNGNVELAREAAKSAEADYREFERQILSEEIGGST